MALFFGGNPFASPVGRKIEQATDPSLTSEDWALNMEICDLINETEDGPKDAMKAIRKRLSQNVSRNFNAIMYTLTVLETCVKNCHKRFLVLVCNKEFVQELVKLISPKNDPPAAVQQKVLNLIQCWADAFKHQPELCGVVQMYTELKQKGTEFPMTDLDAMAPIHTPQKSLPEAGGATKISVNLDSITSSTAMTLTSDQLGKLTSELRVVEGNMTVLSEMLSEIIPGREPPSDMELLKELYTTCQAMQERLVELISQLSNDEITAELLRVNDGLNNLFLRYSRYEKNRKSSSKEREKEPDEGSLIDLNDNATSDRNSVTSQLENLSLTTATATSQLSSIPSVIAHNNKEDEFDMFAQSRNITYESSKAGGSSYEANKEMSNLSSNLGAAAQSRQINNSSPLPIPDLIGMHLEQDFDEMAAWLGEKQEESLTSSEFDKFLAERAAAAEALPSTAGGNSSATPSKRPNKEDPMFAL